MSNAVEDSLVFEEIMGVGGSLGLITLNRPQALNSLTLDMCVSIEAQLAEWERMGQIKAVVIRGEGDKAFCAGGDLRAIYDVKSSVRKSRKFFMHEYRLNHRIFHFPKPYIALMHGITMGGGAGLSVHGSHRVGSEDLVFAMPETGIGFFPDVGGSFFLPRCTGKTGVYMALTGVRLHIADALYAGVVDHMVPKNAFEPIIRAIAESKFSENVNLQVSDIINAFSVEVNGENINKPHLVAYRNEINQSFGHDSIEEIMDSLQNTKNEWSQMIFEKMLEKSPTSLAVTLKQLSLGAQMDFDECLQMEYRIAQHFLSHPDFFEGIRSTLIDKDRTPVWHPDNLEDLSPEVIEIFFEQVDRDLNFDS